MTTPVIRCKKVTKRFGAITALDHISLDIEPGQIMAILGPSGCGKTTLLRTIAGFENIDQGEIYVQGTCVSSETVDVPPNHRQIGIVFQEYSLFPHLNVSQNIGFGLRDISTASRNIRISEILDLMKLTDIENRYPHELSGGQQQRVALARTLAPNPITVLLDEPFSNVDATMRAQLRDEITQILRQNRVTTILVTHDREEAFSTADRIAVMQDGRIEQIDYPEKLFNSPSTRFVARMTGLANFVPASITSGGTATTEIGELSCQSDPDHSSEIDLLVRATDFDISLNKESDVIISSITFRGEDVRVTIQTKSGNHIQIIQPNPFPFDLGTKVDLTPKTDKFFLAFDVNTRTC